MAISPTTGLKINPWLLMGVFFLMVGPFALNFHMHYPDEIYYRDAAIKMLINGDYLTTYLGSDEARFKKPILTYWAVFAGFKVFGVNPFASRILFLIAGMVTIGLTYHLSRLLFKEEKIAGISALIIASNIVLILSSGRSIPDILLVMTMTISALGFAAFLKWGNKAPWWGIWALYLGLALAFEVKGLPAAFLGGIGILFLLLNPWQRISWKKLLHIPALIISAGIAFFWFYAMWRIHGPEFMAAFLDDQVGVRVASKVLLIGQNFLIASLTLLVIFAPWLIFFPKNFLRRIKTIRVENAQFFGFAVLWCVAILILSALTSKFYERYLLPVIPVLAVWLGWILIRLEFEIRVRRQQVVAVVIWVLGLIIFLISFWLYVKSPTNTFTIIKLGIASLVLIYFFILILRRSRLPEMIVYGGLLLFLLISTVTDHVSFPNQGEQLRNQLNLTDDAQTGEVWRKVGFYGNKHVGTKIRIHLYPDINLIDLNRDNWQEASKNYEELIIEDLYFKEMDMTDYQIQGETINGLSSAGLKLLLAKGTPEYEGLLAENSKKYYWLKKK